MELVNRKGTSKKTGQPYDFWGCPGKDGNNFCKFTAPSAKTASPERQQLEAQVLASMNTKLDKLLEGQASIFKLLASIGATLPVEPSKNNTALPF